MQFFLTKFKRIMLICGLLTCTMFQGLFFPQAVLKSNFGSTLEGSLSEIIVRNWSALIGLMGLMLIYGAFVSRVRRYSLVIAGSSKVIFIVLALSLGVEYFKQGLELTVIIDAVMVLLFLAYLLLSRPVSKV